MDSPQYSSSRAAGPSSLQPLRVLITAGPTHEPIDAVRYIGNRSSGRMGIALAEASLDRGWRVTLLLGPVAISPPHHSQLTVLRFQTASDLQSLLHEHWPRHDVLMMAAAVADFQVAGEPASSAAPAKIKRGDGMLTLNLSPTPDILAGLAAQTKANQTTMGFALEPAASLATEAARKLRSKGLDAIVANPLETMGAANVTAALLLADGRRIDAPPNLPKEGFAVWLLDRVGEIVQKRAGRSPRNP